MKKTTKRILVITGFLILLAGGSMMELLILFGSQLPWGN